MRHTSTGTSGDPVILGYATNTSGNKSGSYLSRPAGMSGLRAFRYNGVFSYNQVNLSPAAYGDTTTWYHLAYVYDTSGTPAIRTYVDGVASGTVNSATTFVTDTTDVHLAFASHLGVFTDVVFYSKALSAAEVQQLANVRRPRDLSSCFAWYPEVNPSSLTEDWSGNGNTLSLFGSGTNPAYDDSVPPQPWRRTRSFFYIAAPPPPTELDGAATSGSTLSGSLNTVKPLSGPSTSRSALAGSLNTTKPMVATATSASSCNAWLRPRWGRRTSTSLNGVSRVMGISATANFTLMGWMRSFGTSNTVGAAIRLTGPSCEVNLRVRTNSGAKRWLSVFDSSSTYVLNYEAADDLAWHHLAITFDGTNARAYVDGSLVATSGTLAMSDDFTFFYALRGDTTNTAEVAQVKLWSAALTAAEVASEKTFFTPHNRLSNLTGWWQLSWQDVTLDSSGNGQTLTDDSSAEAQTEAPTGPMILMNGRAYSGSSLSGPLTQLQPLSGASTSASALSAPLNVLAQIIGSSTSASTLSGGLSTTKPMAGPVNSASTFEAEMVVAHALESDGFTSSSALSATPRALVRANSTSASTLSGSLVTVKLMVGAATSASTLRASMSQTVPLAGTASSASTFSGTVGVPGVFVGKVMSASTLGGSLGVTKPLTGSVLSASTFSATAIAPIEAAAYSGSELAGTLALLVTPIAGNASSASTLRGALTMVVNSTTSTSASTLTGSLSARLAGQSTSGSTLSGTLTTLKPLTATMTSNSDLTGVLSGGTPVAGGGGGADDLSRRWLGVVGTRRHVR